MNWPLLLFASQSVKHLLPAMFRVRYQSLLDRIDHKIKQLQRRIAD